MRAFQEGSSNFIWHMFQNMLGIYAIERSFIKGNTVLHKNDKVCSRIYICINPALEMVLSTAYMQPHACGTMQPYSQYVGDITNVRQQRSRSIPQFHELTLVCLSAASISLALTCTHLRPADFALCSDAARAQDNGKPSRPDT